MKGDGMGRQTRRPSSRAMRRRKYMVRRLMVLILFAAAVTGIVFLAKALFSGKIKPNEVASTPTPPLSEGPAEPTPIPTPALAVELPADMGVVKQGEESLSQMGFHSELFVRRDQVDSYNREKGIYFGRGDKYTAVKGVTTYGGNNFRSSFAYGNLATLTGQLTKAWEKPIGQLDCGSDGVWSGTGWTGMPIIVQWEDDVRPLLGVADEFKNKQGFTEVIYPAMDGKIHFMELNTGKQTRSPIDTGVVNKGTAALDPRGYPLLYLGQGIQSTSTEGTYGAWFRVVSLIENKVLQSFGGRDPASNRQWQAYDSSPLFAADSDTLIIGGENGLLYTVKLNTSFDKDAGTITIEPDRLVKYRYHFSGYADNDNARWYGIDSSVAAWHQYAVFTDNGGMLQCVDLNDMTLKYAVDTDGDGDAGVVVEESPSDNTIFLYAANKADGRNAADGRDKAYIRKLDGRTGEIKWTKAFDASAENGGGAYAPVHIGSGDLDGMIIAGMSDVKLNGDDAADGGMLIALDKNTGAELWRVEQNDGMWSAPVVVYDESGTGYVLQCDRGGMLKLYKGIDGSEICSLDLGSRIESTPAVFKNTLVVGTRGVGGSGSSAVIVGIRIG